MENIYTVLLKSLLKNEKKVVKTNLNPNSCNNIKEFNRCVLGDHTSDHDEIKDFSDTLKTGKPRLIEDGDKSYLLEPYYPRERLIILGGGHIALPLVEIGSKAGFHVTVVDDRLNFSNPLRFPLAADVICDSFKHFLGNADITSNDYIVIITRGHRHDQECLKAIISKEEEPQYIGMIGSQKRIRIVKEQLTADGCSWERLDRVCAPIGLPIGAVTPEEIGISIISEIIKRKRLDTKGKDFVNRSDIDYRVIETLSVLKEPCSVVTIISSKGSVPRGAGAKMIVYRDGRIEGSIGGGCSEASVMRTALDIIGTGMYDIYKIDMTGDLAEDEGMVCGGIITVLVEDYQGEGVS